MTKKENDSFEDLCSRLEEIVGSIEDEQLPLEESIKLFTEGVETAYRARRKLEEGGKKVQKLVEKLDGTLELEDLDS